MKAIILKKELNKTRLERTLRRFFYELSKLEYPKSISLSKIVLTLKNGKEFILFEFENMNVKLNDKSKIRAINRVSLSSYLNILNNNKDLNIPKESDSIIFYFTD